MVVVGINIKFVSEVFGWITLMCLGNYIFLASEQLLVHKKCSLFGAICVNCWHSRVCVNKLKVEEDNQICTPLCSHMPPTNGTGSLLNNRFIPKIENKVAAVFIG